jgi:hypothetical protein
MTRQEHVMTNQELYRLAHRRHPTSDALRTLVLILATVLVAIAVTAVVPDEVWADLSAHQTHSMPDWHGNVASH